MNRRYVFLVDAGPIRDEVMFFADDLPGAVQQLRAWLRGEGCEHLASYTLIERPEPVAKLTKQEIEALNLFFLRHYSDPPDYSKLTIADLVKK